MSAIEEKRRLGFCQICGSRKNLHVHHIKTRGAGGTDDPENLVLLCAIHHDMVHRGLLDLDECELVGTRVPSYEELMQMAVECRQQGEAAQWTLGALCSLMTEICQVKRGDIASMLGCSARYVGELIRVWRVFPSDSQRVPDLGWEHHRIAASQMDPKAWIEMAADEEWSTREMRAAVKAVHPVEEAAMVRAKRAWNLVQSVLDGEPEAAAWLLQKLGEIKKDPANRV